MRTPSQLARLLLTLCLGAPFAAACSSAPDTDTEVVPGEGDPALGAELYAEMCATCHGTTAQGGLGPRLAPWTKTIDALVGTIDATMPQGEPEKCDRACAENIAAFITGLSAVDCGGQRALPRRLRLLTRREYRATVADLFQASASAACDADTDCDLATQSCTGGVCTDDPCNLHTFLYDAAATSPSTVHVAGDFNGWPATLAAGGWPMQKAPGTSTYYLKHAVETGSHEYKFVLDESQWITDPGNPKQTGEFGNSVLEITCSAPPGGSGGLGVDPAKDFPAESRPSGFPFDSNEGALATSVHVDQYWKAAALLADAALADVTNLLPCDFSIDPEACARDFVSDFGKRAFRRPLSDVETDRYAAALLAAPDHETGIRIVLRTMLSSPLFLYRSEVGEPADDGSHRLTPHETATLLSYTYWGTMPDEELFSAAESGALATPDDIEKQARRLVAAPRSRPIFETFAVQWLGIEKVASISKDAALFPEWSPALQASMLDETRRFVSHVVFDGSGKYEDLLLAESTFVDAPLATFYGVAPPAAGSGEVPSPDHRKAGLLGHASVLSAYAYSNQSSPILRGLFVRRNLLCQEFPAPPADAATVPAIDPDATTRERFDQHSSDPVCHTCHQYIDHVGFGFEKFDAIGHFRETENGKPIDASGDMNDVESLGTDTHAPFDSLRGLGEELAQSHAARACFAKQTYRFTMGRLESADDVCGIDELSAAFEQSGGDIKELWIHLSRLEELTRRK